MARRLVPRCAASLASSGGIAARAALASLGLRRLFLLLLVHRICARSSLTDVVE